MKNVLAAQGYIVGPTAVIALVEGSIGGRASYLEFAKVGPDFCAEARRVGMTKDIHVSNVAEEILVSPPRSVIDRKNAFALLRVSANSEVAGASFHYK